MHAAHNFEQPSMGSQKVNSAGADLQWFKGVCTNPPFSRHPLAGSCSEPHPRSEGGSSSSKTSELASDSKHDSKLTHSENEL